MLLVMFVRSSADAFLRLMSDRFATRSPIIVVCVLLPTPEAREDIMASSIGWIRVPRQVARGCRIIPHDRLGAESRWDLKGEIAVPLGYVGTQAKARY